MRRIGGPRDPILGVTLAMQDGPGHQMPGVLPIAAVRITALTCGHGLDPHIFPGWTVPLSGIRAE